MFCPEGSRRGTFPSLYGTAQLSDVSWLALCVSFEGEVFGFAEFFRLNVELLELLLESTVISGEHGVAHAHSCVFKDGVESSHGCDRFGVSSFRLCDGGSNEC